MGKVVASQQALVLNAFAMLLQNNLVTGDAVTWNELDAEMDDRNGLKVIEQTSPRYRVTRTEGGVRDLTTGTDDSVFGSELFEITGTFNANMGWGDFQAIRDIQSARRSEALKGAAVSMAEQIDAYILGVAGLASADWVGDGSSAVSAWNLAAAAHTRLAENGVNDDGLSYILNYTDKERLGSSVTQLPAPDGMATSTFRRGFTGEIDGIRTMFTNQLPVFSTGSRSSTTAAVNGANQNVDYSAVARAGTVNGRSLTQTLNVNAGGNTVTYKKGEVFTIAGVFAYDNRKQGPVTPARLQQFTVVADATASGTGEVALTIFPAIIVPGSGTGSEIATNQAQATVTAAPASGALLTFKGDASSQLSPRMLIQKQAIVVNTAPLIMPSSDTAARRKLSKIPLTVRMWSHSDFHTGAHGVRFDVALNANIRERRRISRLNG